MYDPVPLDITTVTDAVLDITNGFLINRSLTLTVRRAKLENPYVLADAMRIREVLVNILSNAVKFTEDNDLNAEIATIQLEEYGMQVTRAADGKEVVEVFADHPAGTFDIILMDVMMPKMCRHPWTRA